MNIHHIFKTWVLALLLGFTTTTAWGIEQVPSVANTISSASINDVRQLTVSGMLERELFYTGKVYAVVNFNGSDYAPIDQVVSADAFSVNPGNEGLQYTINFDLNVLPTAEDQMVMVWRDENATPLDIDPIFFASDTVFATEPAVVSYTIEKCRYDQEINVIFCASQGTVPEQLTVEWYEKSVYNGKKISTQAVSVVIDSEKSFTLQTDVLPTKDGLYPFVIRETNGRHVYQGSSRVGEVFIPELADKTQESAFNSIDMAFVSKIAALLFGFIFIAWAARIVLMGNTKMRFAYAGILLILVGLLGYWYQAQAAVYESTDYRQFRYSVSVDPIGDEQYYISFGAIDTYTSTPPQNQRVQFTVDGVNYVDLINDNAGAWSHTRQVTIPDSASTTAAVRVVDGCASYYGFTSFNGASRYGTYDCGPMALFPSEESITGCMNPEANNYNSRAVISSDDCQFGGCTLSTALNYDPSATIDDGSCVIEGCINPNASNYNTNANIDDGTCVCNGGSCADIYGCTNPAANNYNSNATIDDGSCVCPDGSCVTQISGCMNPVADNYNSNATIDDGSCLCGGVPCVGVYGCTNTASPNYNSNATIDDGSCSACYWTPSIPNPTTYCAFESFTQTNSCDGTTRVVSGTKLRQWVPNLTSGDICTGNSIAQSEVCSGINPAPRRIINGTGNGAFCILPDADFLISTNLVNWTTCDAIDRLRIVRPNQPVYLRSSGNVTIDTWSVNQALGEITGVVTNHQDNVYKINFSYPVQKKNYEDVIIQGSSFGGNTTSQSCDITLLNFDIKEI